MYFLLYSYWVKASKSASILQNILKFVPWSVPKSINKKAITLFKCIEMARNVGDVCLGCILFEIFNFQLDMLLSEKVPI